MITLDFVQPNSITMKGYDNPVILLNKILKQELDFQLMIALSKDRSLQQVEPFWQVNSLWNINLHVILRVAATMHRLIMVQDIVFLTMLL